MPDAANLDDLLPEFRIQLDDLSRASDEALRARSVSALGRLACLLLKHGRALRARPGPDSLGAFVRAVADLLAALPRFDRQRAWVCILEATAEPEADLVIEAQREALPPEQQEYVMTAGEALRLEGERRGRLEGKRETLRSLLRGEFEQLSTETERRVAEAEEHALDRWTKAVLFASTIDEACADD